MISGQKLGLEGIFDSSILGLVIFTHFRSVDILCGPHQLDHLKDELFRHGVEFSIMIEDVQKLAEMAPMTKGTNNK